MSDRPLPSFQKPPVVETVLGVQFKPLRGFSNAHLGAFWKRIAGSSFAGEQWPIVSDAPHLEPCFERFGQEHAWSKIGLTLQVSPGPPPARVQIRNQSGDALIQVQNGRLHYNWIRRQEGGYPRYAKVRPRFDELKALFEQFLREEGIEDLQANQWEVTYVNHIPAGTVWQSPRDWVKLFGGLPGVVADAGGTRLESLGASWHFEIPERRGRLHIDLKHGKFEESESKEVLRLTLTARGPVDKRTTLSDGLDLGRRSIVLAFRDVTSEEAHTFWELEP